MLADEDLTKGAESTLRLVGETIATIHQFYSREFFFCGIFFLGHLTKSAATIHQCKACWLEQHQHPSLLVYYHWKCVWVFVWVVDYDRTWVQ